MSGPELESGVRQRMRDPEDEEVALLVKVTESSEEVIAAIESSGQSVEVEEELPLEYLAVRASDTDIESLCDVEGVAKVEIEGSGAMMSSDFRSRPGSAP